MDQPQSTLCEVRSFCERDIDIWLAEELRNNAEFGRWFLDQCDVTSRVTLPARRVQVSVAAEDGETDVQALFDLADNTTLAVLVENKIEHSITSDQINRYVDRGRYGQVQGRWQQCRIALFAPASKITQYSVVIGGVAAISFEAAADFLRGEASDQRALYRAEFILRAATKWTIESDGADEFRVKFWTSLYSMVERKFPNYFALDIKRYPKTTFISANSIDAKKLRYFRLDLKGHMGEVDLAFEPVRPAELIPFLEKNKPDGASVAFNKGSIAVRIKGLEKFTVSEGFKSAEPQAIRAFQTAQTLLEFWKKNRSFLDGHYTSNDEARSNS